MEIEIKLGTKYVKELIREVLNELDVTPLKPYEYIITPDMDEAKDLIVTLNGVVLNNAVKIVLDSRIKPTQDKVLRGAQGGESEDNNKEEVKEDLDSLLYPKKKARRTEMELF